MLAESIFQTSSLCVVGNLNRDLKTTPLRSGEHLFHDGETSVASITETIGGGGANSACAAAVLGAKVSFVGKVGADMLGERLEKTLARLGIASHLKHDSLHATGTSLGLSFDSGQRHFISCLPNNESLAFGDLDPRAWAGCQHLLRADVWFSKAMLFGGNEQLFHAARQMGLATSIDLNWDPHWAVASAATMRDRKQAVRAVLPLVNLAHGNTRELIEFTGASNLETALKRLTDWGVEAVVVHLGENGAGYFHQGTMQVEPPVPVQTHVNTTGTGDVLSVCMMLLHQHAEVSLQQKLQLANTIVSQFIEGKRKLIPALAA